MSMSLIVLLPVMLLGIVGPLCFVGCALATHGMPDSIRILDIRALADRVFGDEQKADDWLHRPNRSLSGQKPVDLLNDELGAAVVREMLEQIDHGMFA
jgi:hypothetical protein